MQFAIGDIILYLLFIIPIALWLYVRMRFVSKQKKYWREIVSNKDEYSKIIVSAVTETKILEKDFIDEVGAKLFIESFKKFPPVDDVIKTISFMRGFISAIEKNPELLEDKEKIQREVVRPLMQQCLFFLAVMDTEIRKIIEDRVKKAEEAGEDTEELIKPLLQAAVSIISSGE